MPFSFNSTVNLYGAGNFNQKPLSQKRKGTSVKNKKKEIPVKKKFQSKNFLTEKKIFGKKGTTDTRTERREYFVENCPY